MTLQQAGKAGENEVKRDHSQSVFLNLLSPHSVYQRFNPKQKGAESPMAGLLTVRPLAEKGGFPFFVDLNSRIQNHSEYPTLKCHEVMNQFPSLKIQSFKFEAERVGSKQRLEAYWEYFHDLLTYYNLFEENSSQKLVFLTLKKLNQLSPVVTKLQYFGATLHPKTKDLLDCIIQDPEPLSPLRRPQRKRDIDKNQQKTEQKAIQNLPLQQPAQNQKPAAQQQKISKEQLAIEPKEASQEQSVAQQNKNSQEKSDEQQNQNLQGKTNEDQRERLEEIKKQEERKKQEEIKKSEQRKRFEEKKKEQQMAKADVIMFVVSPAVKGKSLYSMIKSNTIHQISNRALHRIILNIFWKFVKGGGVENFVFTLQNIYLLKRSPLNDTASNGCEPYEIQVDFSSPIALSQIYESYQMAIDPRLSSQEKDKIHQVKGMAERQKMSLYQELYPFMWFVFKNRLSTASNWKEINRIWNFVAIVAMLVCRRTLDVPQSALKTDLFKNKCSQVRQEICKGYTNIIEKSKDRIQTFEAENQLRPGSLRNLFEVFSLEKEDQKDYVEEEREESSLKANSWSDIFFMLLLKNDSKTLSSFAQKYELGSFNDSLQQFFSDSSLFCELKCLKASHFNLESEILENCAKRLNSGKIQVVSKLLYFAIAFKVDIPYILKLTKSETWTDCFNLTERDPYILELCNTISNAVYSKMRNYAINKENKEIFFQSRSIRDINYSIRNKFNLDANDNLSPTVQKIIIDLHYSYFNRRQSFDQEELKNVVTKIWQNVQYKVLEKNKVSTKLEQFKQDCIGKIQSIVKANLKNIDETKLAQELHELKDRILKILNQYSDQFNAVAPENPGKNLSRALFSMKMQQIKRSLEKEESLNYLE